MKIAEKILSTKETVNEDNGNLMDLVQVIASKSGKITSIPVDFDGRNSFDVFVSKGKSGSVDVSLDTKNDKMKVSLFSSFHPLDFFEWLDKVKTKDLEKALDKVLSQDGGPVKVLKKTFSSGVMDN